MMTLLHHAASMMVVTCAVIKMNHMTLKTHPVDIALWWMLGVAAFAELWDYKPSIGWPDTAFVMAVALWALRDVAVSFGIIDLRKRNLGFSLQRRQGDKA